MQIEWLQKSGKKCLILFFNGWGMDGAAVSHLKGECDILVVYDYREIGGNHFPSLEDYREIYVVAWSMGVWAAARVIPTLAVAPVALVAINGTGKPVDDEWGIPSRVYLLTEKGMNQEGREKFFKRMLSGPEEELRFRRNKAGRSLESACEELVQIRKQCTGMADGVKWNKVYISENDVIFPVKNQLKWWQEQGVPVRTLAGGHYPFYQFKCWEEIIGV